MDGGEAGVNALQTQLCGLPADLLQEAERLFLTQLDFRKLFTVTDQSGSKNAGLCVKTEASCVCLMCVCASCQRERLMANAEDLRSISQAVTLVSQELAALIDDVRKHYYY